MFGTPTVDGGNAIDVVATNFGNTTLDVVDLSGSGANALTLTLQDLIDDVEASDALLVLGGAGDGVNVAGGPWVNHGAVVLDGASYLQYTLGSATLYLDPDVILL